MKRVLQGLTWALLGDDRWMLTLMAAIMAATFGFAVFSFHMESATFNRLTGANTTWKDAAWVELRVQGETK